jgi:hypothetical protein
MADPKKSIKDVEKELEALKSKLDKTTSDSLSKIIDRLKSGKASIAEWNTQLELFSIKADSLADSLDYISRSFTDSVNELKKQNEYITQQVRSTRKLSSIANDLLSMRRGDSTYDLKKIKNLEEQARKHRRILESQIQQSVEGSKERNDLIDRISKTDDLLSNFKDITGEAKKFQKSMGITGGILKGMAKIPIVGNMLGTQEALEAAEEAAQNGASRLGTMGAAAKSMGKSLMTSLSDPLVIIGALAKGLKMAWDVMMGVDKQTEGFARSMNITYSESINVRQEMGRIMNLNKDSLALSTDYLETLSFVGNQLGSNAKLNEKDLVTFTKLKVQAGLTNEELMGMQGLSLANGKYLEKNTKEFLAQVKITSLSNKVVLDEKRLMTEINKISAATTLSLGKNPKALGEAVATAKALGMEMSQLENIAGSLLDFESSIENELSAELLLGKNINLERARQLALNNDIAGVAEEINSQIGSSAEYAKMNRIQQEALAKAVGMNREELAQTLFTQEQLQGLSSEVAADRQAILDKRIEEVGLTQAQRELEEEGIEKLEQQYGISTAIEQAIGRVKELFAQFILPYFEKLIESSGGVEGLWNTISGTISKIVSGAQLLFKVLMSIKAAQIAYNAASAISLAIQKKQALASKQEAGAEIVSASAKTFGGIPIVGLALAAAAAIATFSGLSSLMNDGVISPTAGGSGYGSRVLFGPEGAISFNNKDTIVAGTNLFSKGDDVISSGKGSIQMGGGREVIDAINSLKQSVNALASRPINVSIDGEKVIKATTGANPNTDSDEMNKNSFRTQ